jgi:hypothetical protein
VLKIDDDRYRRHCERCGDDGAYSKNNHCSRPVAHRHDAALCLKMLLNAYFAPLHLHVLNRSRHKKHAALQML